MLGTSISKVTAVFRIKGAYMPRISAASRLVAGRIINSDLSIVVFPVCSFIFIVLHCNEYTTRTNASQRLFAAERKIPCIKVVKFA